MKKILCLYAHPNPAGSRANKRIIERLLSLPNLTLHPIYDLYPEFSIDVAKEKELLLSHDALLIQHPFYWYNMPPLLKYWFDMVLEFNFAYGPKGEALRGKDFILSITTGGPQESYQPTGSHRFHIKDFFPPYQATALLCGMKWHEPFVLHHALKVSEDQLEAHAEKIRESIFHICQGEKI